MDAKIKLLTNNINSINHTNLTAEQIKKCVTETSVIRKMDINDVIDELLIYNEVIKYLKSKKLPLNFDRNEIIETIGENFHEKDGLDIMKSYIILDPTLANEPEMFLDVISGIYVLPKVLELALQHGLDPNIKLEERGNIPILAYVMYCVEHELYDEFENNEFAENEKQKVYKDHRKIIALLLRYGADPNVLSDDKYIHSRMTWGKGYKKDPLNTLFHDVAGGQFSGRYIDLFLRYRADPNVKNSKGETPFMKYCKNYYYTKTLTRDKIIQELKLFKKRKTDFKTKDAEGHGCDYYGDIPTYITYL